MVLQHLLREHRIGASAPCAEITHRAPPEFGAVPGRRTMLSQPSLSRRASIAARLVAAAFAMSALLGAVAVPAAAADRV
jgi:hypothetical protein